MRFFTLGLAFLLLVGASIATDTPVDSTADDTPTTITLKWSARSETSIYGYLVYRSERRQGPFLRINPEIIHLTGPADDATTNDYVYQDTTAQPGTTYFYYLDTISKEGHKNRFSGVLKKTAPPNSTTHPDAE